MNRLTGKLTCGKVLLLETFGFGFVHTDNLILAKVDKKCPVVTSAQ